MTLYPDTNDGKVYTQDELETLFNEEIASFDEEGFNRWTSTKFDDYLAESILVGIYHQVDEDDDEDGVAEADNA